MAETLASYSVPESHVKMYTANVVAALNKAGGILTPLVSQGSYRGEKVQMITFLGPVDFVERDTVYQDTKYSEIEHTQRWISGREYDVAILIDRLDVLKMIFDPTSPYVERVREGAARKRDDIIMGKFFAIAKSGKDGNTDTAFPNRDIVPHGSVGLTVAKLRALRKLMKKRYIDLRSRMPKIAITAEQADNLLGETQINSIDYNAVKPLVNGEVNTFMGFEFVPFEDYRGQGIPTHTDTGHLIRDCPAWVPDGMHFGVWDELSVNIDRLPTKNNIRQIHATFTAGATRVEEGKVFQCQCQET